MAVEESTDKIELRVKISVAEEVDSDSDSVFSDAEESDSESVFSDACTEDLCESDYEFEDKFIRPLLTSLPEDSETSGSESNEQKIEDKGEIKREPLKNHVTIIQKIYDAFF